MTYCLALALDAGIVCVSDSRTNAGIDDVAVYSKMHRFVAPGRAAFVLMSAGNLATSQAGVARLKRDEALYGFEHMADAAAYVGEVSQDAQNAGREGQMQGVEFQASFILAGQIAGEAPCAMLVYPQGNHIRATRDTAFLQIGELKTGKAILDRLVRPELPLESAARIALVSMEAAMRSNLSVGPPVEMVIYRRDALDIDRYAKFDADNAYWRRLSRTWSDELGAAVERLPKFDWEM
jgi:putative proteasome-type protease